MDIDILVGSIACFLLQLWNYLWYETGDYILIYYNQYIDGIRQMV